MSQVTIANVAGRRVVYGLEWRPLGEDPKAEMRQAAQAAGTRHGVMFEDLTGHQLVGLLPMNAPIAARSAISAAAWLATAIDYPILYIEWRANGHFWIFAGGRGEIEPRFDKILSEEEAVGLLDGILGEAMSDSPDDRYHIYVADGRCPPSNILERFQRETRTFASLVDSAPVHKHHRVRQLYGVTPAAIAAVVSMIMLAGAGYAATEWLEAEKAKREFEAQRQRAEQERIAAEYLQTQTELRIAQAVATAVAMDTSAPEPTKFLEACFEPVAKFGRRIAGWSFVRASCQAGSTNVELAYELGGVVGGGFGTNETLAAHFAPHGLVPVFDVATNRAVVVVPGDAVEPRTPVKPPDLPLLQDVVEGMASRMQLAHQVGNALTFTITAPSNKNVTYLDPAKENTEDPARFVPVPPDRCYREGKVNVQGDAIWLAGDVSFDWPFFRVMKVEVVAGQAGELDWRLEGAYVVSRS